MKDGNIKGNRKDFIEHIREFALENGLTFDLCERVVRYQYKVLSDAMSKEVPTEDVQYMNFGKFCFKSNAVVDRLRHQADMRMRNRVMGNEFELPYVKAARLLKQGVIEKKEDFDWRNDLSDPDYVKKRRKYYYDRADVLYYSMMMRKIGNVWAVNKYRKDWRRHFKGTFMLYGIKVKSKKDASFMIMNIEKKKRLAKKAKEEGDE